MMRPAVHRVSIHEVAPRDGLQIEPVFLPTAQKVSLVDALATTGITKIEVSSFVSPKSVPNLADAAQVFARIKRNPAVIYSALVANARGGLAAIAAGADEVNFVISASETHNRANVRKSCAESFDHCRELAIALRGRRIRLNGTIATAFGCPFEGRQSAEKVLAFVDRYLSLGASGITLADTTGMAHPAQVADLVADVLQRCGGVPVTLHFHNTRGMGLANVLAALGAGATCFDASLGGIGGCPFAPGATGNVCTEDLVHMVEEMGIATGVDLAALLRIARELPGWLGHDVPGQVAKAGRSCDLHPSSFANQ